MLHYSQREIITDTNPSTPSSLPNYQSLNKIISKAESNRAYSGKFQNRFSRDTELRRHNSTETIFMQSDMHAPDNKEIVYSLSVVLHVVLKQHSNLVVKRNPVYEIFSEEKYPLSKEVELYRIPEKEEIEREIMNIFVRQSLSAECGLMSAIYIDRLINATKLTLSPANWRRILIAALILANKVWEDIAVWNVDYVKMYPNSTIEDLNRLESNFLHFIQFNLVIKPSVYAEYFFELRSKLDNYTLTPLDKETAKKLEARSRGLEEKVKMRLIKEQRSKSLMPSTVPSPACISLEEFRRLSGKKDG